LFYSAGAIVELAAVTAVIIINSTVLGRWVRQQFPISGFLGSKLRKGYPFRMCLGYKRGRENISKNEDKE
jgi:hypothetical protein